MKKVGVYHEWNLHPQFEFLFDCKESDESAARKQNFFNFNWLHKTWISRTWIQALIYTHWKVNH